MTTIVLPLKVKLAHMRKSLMDLEHKQLAIQPRNKKRPETQNLAPSFNVPNSQNVSTSLQRENEDLKFKVAERDIEISSLQSELTVLRRELNVYKNTPRRSILKKKVSIREPREVILYDIDYA